MSEPTSTERLLLRAVLATPPELKEMIAVIGEERSKVGTGEKDRALICLRIAITSIAAARFGVGWKD